MEFEGLVCGLNRFGVGFVGVSYDGLEIDFEGKGGF